MSEIPNYAAYLQAGQGLVPDYRMSMLQDQQIKLAQSQEQRLSQAATLDAQKQRQAQQRELDFRNASEQVMLNPTSDAIAKLALRFPEKAEDLKRGWDLMDAGQKQADLTAMGSVYAAANSGDFKLAADTLEKRVVADRAAGQEDPHDLAILAALKSNDPIQQKAAVGQIGIGLAMLAGPEKFAGALKDLQGNLSPKIREYNDRVAQFGKDAADQWLAVDDTKLIPVNEGGSLYNAADLIGGGQASTGGAAAPNTAAPVEVSTVLSQAGIPPVVIAGFLGNFQHESDLGSNKGSGDGGTAHGLAQWRHERVANFERVIGKHPNQASLAEQAQFVAWEMKNPLAAGMTVAQRDRIMAAKTPEQAAALIDKYYERSDGKSRGSRQKAAKSHYSGMPITKAVNGQTYYQINGKWFDNPEGR